MVIDLYEYCLLFKDGLIFFFIVRLVFNINFWIEVWYKFLRDFS